MTTTAEKLRLKSDRPRRRVALKLVRVDVWSATKLGFLLSLAIGAVSVVATCLLWALLSALGVFHSVDAFISSLSPSTSTASSGIVSGALGLPTVLLLALVGAILLTLAGTVLAPIAALLYNLSVRITRGILVAVENG